MGQQQSERRDPNPGQGQSQRQPEQRKPQQDRPQRDDSREQRKQG
jgi:hypothetical protein